MIFSYFTVYITKVLFFCQSNALWKKNMWHHRSSRHNVMKTTVCLHNKCANCTGWHAHAQSAFILDLPESSTAYLFVENKNLFPATPNFLWHDMHSNSKCCLICAVSAALHGHCFFPRISKLNEANF